MIGTFWSLRTGSPWCGLPARFGPCTTAFNRVNQWVKAGVCIEAIETLSENLMTECNASPPRSSGRISRRRGQMQQVQPLAVLAVE
ncbi:transposase [Sedimentitalea sp. HM32M-2]|uniref:transposase n=1 Tax=Sedimentitalea sp. HM32M-2 TaxID=3351566 RepID=UPI0036279402